MKNTAENFDLREPARGVYAALHREGGSAFSNAGIVDLGGRTLVFDACDSPAAGQELHRLAVELTGRAPDLLINSHYHRDHWSGNQAFADTAVILATEGTRRKMMPDVKEIEKEKTGLPGLRIHLEEMRAKLDLEQDPGSKEALKQQVDRLQGTVASLPLLEPTLPTATFTGGMTFHGTIRRAQLVATPPAHSPSDCHLFLPEDGILFAGDLGFFQMPAYIARDVDLDGWLKVLDGLAASRRIRTIVPGHGPMGSRQDLRRTADYLTFMRELAQSARREGFKPGDLPPVQLPARFAGWERFPRRLANSLKNLYDQIG